MPVITVNQSTASSICSGSPLEVNFSVTTVPFSEGNIFMVQLAGPENRLIGTLAATATGNYTINCTNTSDLLAGDYTLTIQGVNEGFSTYSNPVSLLVNALPTSYFVSGGGTYCEGDGGLLVYLDGSEPNIEYQLTRTFNGVTNNVGDPILGDYSIISFGNQELAGDYRVIAKDLTTQCTKIMTGIPAIIVNPKPVMFNVIGGGSICENTNGVQIGLDGSTVGVNYALYLNEGIWLTTKTGTGTAFYFDGFYNRAGSYTVIATNSSYCTNNMIGSAVIETRPAPTEFIVTGGGEICPGSVGLPVGLDGSDLNVVYKLYRQGTVIEGSEIIGTGSAISFGLMNVPGGYSVSAENNGCVKFMATSATIVELPVPQVFELSSPTNGHFCNGSTGAELNLNGSEEGFVYTIKLDGELYGSFNGTGSAIVLSGYSTLGTYTVEATNNTTGCHSLMNGSVNVVMDELIAPANASPIGNDITINPTHFTWDLVGCAASYQLTISSNANLSSPVVDVNISANNILLPYNVNTLVGGTTYFYRITAINGNISVPSDIWSFTTISANPTQNIQISHGWNIISSNIYPQDVSLPTVLQNIINSVLIIKDGNGAFWMPPSTGTLTTWNALNGYQIYVTSPQTLSVTGLRVPVTTPIPLSAGWNMVSYLPEFPLQASSATASIQNKLVIVKNGAGEFYWPMFGANTLNNSTGTMEPGLGYWVYVVNNCELVYSNAQSRVGETNGFDIEPKVEVLKASTKSTGDNANLIFVTNNLSEGTEIAAFGIENKILGSGVVHNGRAVMTICGRNSTTSLAEGASKGEVLTLKAYDKATNSLSVIIPSKVEELTSSTTSKTINYRSNGLFVVYGSSTEKAETLRIGSNPNPVTEYSKVEFELPQSGSVSIDLFTSDGVKVARLLQDSFNRGLYSIDFNSADLSSGSYNLVLRFGSQVATSKMIIVK